MSTYPDPRAQTADPNSEMRNLRIEGRQTLSFEPTPMQLKAAAQQHKQQTETQDRVHERLQETKDNDARRQRETVGFYLLLTVVLSGLVASGIVGVASHNADRRDFAQAVCTLILGGLLGALAGYFTGKATK